jgi:hypothetical protein
MSSETYLGDGLYASDEGGYMLRLRAPRLNGDHVVYLENNVLDEFIKFVEKARGVKFTVEKAPPSQDGEFEHLDEEERQPGTMEDL